MRLHEEHWKPWISATVLPRTNEVSLVMFLKGGAPRKEALLQKPFQAENPYKLQLSK